MYKIYQVEYGDTLDIIANKTGTTRQNIENINGFTGDSDLVVGSLIVVPRNQNDIFTTYKVQKGDNVYSISKRYNVSPDIILMLNGLSKSDYIYPDQELLVPQSGISVYVTQDGDTYNDIAMKMGINPNTLNNENKRIYVLPDQLVVSKKETNN